MPTPLAALTFPTLRPAHAADGPAVAAFLQGLSTRNRWFRFHGASSGASPALLRLLCDVDGTRHQAWLAWSGDGDDAVVVGEARFVMTESDGRGAEFAIAVADDWQGTGLADALLRQLLVAAEGAGVPSLYGDVMDGNGRMQSFMRRHSFRARRMACGSIVRMCREFVARCAEQGAAWAPDLERRQAAATACV